jgi:hypothetical protein
LLQEAKSYKKFNGAKGLGRGMEKLASAELVSFGNGVETG